MRAARNPTSKTKLVLISMLVGLAAASWSILASERAASSARIVGCRIEEMVVSVLRMGYYALLDVGKRWCGRKLESCRPWD